MPKQPPQKVTTIRLEGVQQQSIEAAAKLDGSAVADVIRTAIWEYMGRRIMNDSVYREEVNNILENRYNEDIASLHEVLGNFEAPPYPGLEIYLGPNE